MILQYQKISDNFIKLNGLFMKCTIEGGPYGLSIFDTNGKFIGVIGETGFALDLDYQHSKTIAVELHNRKIHVFDYSTFTDVILQDLLDEIELQEASNA